MQVRFSAVGKGYAARVVLRQVDLDIASGEFVAIVGASGSGKSTLLRLLAGLDSCDGGAIHLDGAPLQGLNRAARVMFQDARLLPWRRVADNVRLTLRGEDRRRAAGVLDLVGLRERANDWPAALSGGQRQRVALARALASAPRLLLLDEPLGALDALTRVEMQRLIEDVWRRHGFTAVLVTHDCAEAVALADRVAVLEEGRLAVQIPVPLPRPRDRNDPRFAALVGRVLQRIVTPGPQRPVVFPTAAAAPPADWAVPAPEEIATGVATLGRRGAVR